MSYFSETFPKKFCRSDDHRPSNKPEPLYNDFWDTLYKAQKLITNQIYVERSYQEQTSTTNNEATMHEN